MSGRTARAILLTGAGGFVGLHAAGAIRARWPEAVLHAPPFDVAEPGSADEIVRSTRPDVCLHLAAISAVPAARDAPEGAWSVNLHGTLLLARALRRHAPDCLLLFAGSADSYGASFRPGLPLDETAPLRPLNTYAATKAAADLALGAMAASDGLRVVRFRPFNHIGPGQREDFVVSAFARQLALIEAGRQAPILSVGNLDPERDFLDVRDVARAYAEAADPDRFGAATDLVLNLASGTPRRVGDVLSALLALSPASVTVERDPGRMRAADIERATGCAERAARELGWRPLIGWSQTLADVLDDWRGRVRAPS